WCQLPIAEKVVAVSAGGYHSLILTAQGQLYGCGWNENGQLGLGTDVANQRTWCQLPIAEKVVAVSAGTYHSLILTAQSQLYGCGSNGNGRLGLGAYVALFRSWCQLPIAEKVVAVSAGAYHSLILTAQGQLYGCG